MLCNEEEGVKPAAEKSDPARSDITPNRTESVLVKRHRWQVAVVCVLVLRTRTYPNVVHEHAVGIFRP